MAGSLSCPFVVSVGIWPSKSASGRGRRRGTTSEATTMAAGGLLLKPCVCCRCTGTVSSNDAM